MKTHILGVILRASKRNKTAEFYKALGLSTHEHAHGGPKHHEIGPLADDAVVELYQQSAEYSRDALIVGVSSLDEALAVAVSFRVRIDTRLVETKRMAYITDPDGRSILLIEQGTDQ